VSEYKTYLSDKHKIYSISEKPFSSFLHSLTSSLSECVIRGIHENKGRILALSLLIAELESKPNHNVHLSGYLLPLLNLPLLV